MAKIYIQNILLLMFFIVPLGFTFSRCMSNSSLDDEETTSQENTNLPKNTIPLTKFAKQVFKGCFKTFYGPISCVCCHLYLYASTSILGIVFLGLLCGVIIPLKSAYENPHNCIKLTQCLEYLGKNNVTLAEGELSILKNMIRCKEAVKKICEMCENILGDCMNYIGTNI
jgi:hypothetical protein